MRLLDNIVDPFAATLGNLRGRNNTAVEKDEVIFYTILNDIGHQLLEAGQTWQSPSGNGDYTLRLDDELLWLSFDGSKMNGSSNKFGRMLSILTQAEEMGLTVFQISENEFSPYVGRTFHDMFIITFPSVKREQLSDYITDEALSYGF